MERWRISALTAQWAALGLLIVFFWGGCQPHYSPKPRGYFRIEFPEKSYTSFSSDCPYTFSIPVYAEMEPDRSTDAQPCWMDVHFPRFNARIHLSYMPISGPDNFNELVEDA